MQSYNIQDAQAQLSRLVEQAARGEQFIITKAGKPMVKVTALETAESPRINRFGFMAGQIQIPEDFDRMKNQEIENLFEKGA